MDGVVLPIIPVRPENTSVIFEAVFSTAVNTSKIPPFVPTDWANELKAFPSLVDAVSTVSSC